MKHLKKLNAKGFAHWILPVIVLVIIGGIGSYAYLRSSNAATVSTYTPSTVCGPGYRLAETYYVKYGTASGPAKVYIMVNASKKLICGTTISTGSEYGKPKQMGIEIGIWNASRTSLVQKASDFSTATDPFKYYAGPVRISYSNYPTPTSRKVYFHVYGYTTFNSHKYTYLVNTGPTLAGILEAGGVY